MIKIEEQILNNLEFIKKNIYSYNYEIETSIEMLPNLIKLGKTKKEKLQILMMCYISNPSLNELRDWSLNTFKRYVKQTDDFYEHDLYYFNKCYKLIELTKGRVI